MKRLPSFFALVWLINLFAYSQLRLVDPQDGNYVSGAYEVILAIENDAEVVQTRVFLDDQLLFDKEGWQAKVVIQFGDGTVPQKLRSEVLLRSGETLSSETIETQPIQIDYVETSRAILISAVVKNRKRQHLTDLNRGQFQVLEDGNTLEIQSFNYENLPLDLVMVLDTSSSLRDGVVELKRAAGTFLRQLSPSDLVALFEIKNRPRKVQDFTNDRKLLLSHIQSMESLGRTAFFDTATLALEALPAKRRGRRTIILFTDGRDSVYEEPRTKARHLREIIAAAQDKEVAIFTVGLGKRINAAALERMAEETGGRFLFAENPQKLPALFEEIVLDLKHQYVLGVIPESRKKGFHKLEVRVKKRGAKIFARKGYTSR